MFGGRPAIGVALAVVILAVLIGVPLGMVAGYRGGWLDEALMRITDLFLAFPPLLLAMVIAATLGASLVPRGTRARDLVVAVVRPPRAEP